jgi:hypothetical protein
LLGVLVLSGASACGTSQQNSLRDKAPGSVLSTALASAVKFGGVHYVLQTTSAGQTQTVTGDAGTDNGAQSIVIGPDQTVVDVVGGSAFLRGNAAGLQYIIGMTAAQASHAAGEWISLQKSDSLYGTVVQGVTLSSLLAELRPVPPLIESTPGTVSGQQVVGVRGGLQSAPGQGEATFWVATASPNVPVGIDAQAKSVSTGKTITQVGVFSKWGARFRVPTPAGSVPFSSLAAN